MTMDRGMKGNCANTATPAIGAPRALSDRVMETSSMSPYSSNPSPPPRSLLAASAQGSSDEPRP